MIFSFSSLSQCLSLCIHFEREYKNMTTDNDDDTILKPKILIDRHFDLKFHSEVAKVVNTFSFIYLLMSNNDDNFSLNFSLSDFDGRTLPSLSSLFWYECFRSVKSNTFGQVSDFQVCLVTSVDSYIN